MSMKCQIGFYNEEPKGRTDIMGRWQSLLYRHSDGYPEGLVPDILPVIREFMSKCGWDPEYMSACVMAQMKRAHCGKPQGEIRFLGHGICRDFHQDIEYFYAVTPTDIIVYRTDGVKTFTEKGRHKLA